MIYWILIVTNLISASLFFHYGTHRMVERFRTLQSDIIMDILTEIHPNIPKEQLTVAAQKACLNLIMKETYGRKV